MFGVGSGEIILILVIAMLVVGPERMVTFARDAGEMLAKFRRETDSVTSEFKEAFSLEPAAEEEDEDAPTEPKSDGAQAGSAPVSVATSEPSSPSIAPVASAFADSEVTRASSAPTAAGGAAHVEATTVLAMPEEETPDQVDVYEVTVIDGPEIVEDEESEATISPVQSEG